MTAALIICVAIVAAAWLFNATHKGGTQPAKRRPEAPPPSHLPPRNPPASVPARSPPRRRVGATAKRDAEVAEKWESIVRRAPKIEGHPDEPYACDVIGESYYQDALEAIVGGKTEAGVAFKCKALLSPSRRGARSEDHEGSVTVYINGRRVGMLEIDAEQYDDWLEDRGIRYGPVVVEAIVVGGWRRPESEGKFGVNVQF